jgi:hypothetical protein
MLTVERCVHAPDIDQQTHHRHADGTVGILQQLLLQYLAAFAAFRHGIDVDFRKGEARGAIAVLGEAFCLIIEDQLQEIILDILAPKGNAILLLQMADLVAGVDGRHAAARIASGRGGGRSVHWLVAVLGRGVDLGLGSF